MSGAHLDRGMRVGVDIGGTFTDLVFVRANGRLDRRKVPTTPDDYGRAILEGIADYCREHAIAASEVCEVTHATTVATNAILERQGVRTGLVTTEGFRDVLEFRRLRVPMSFDLGWQKPAPLVERACRFTVNERIDAKGNVIKALDEAELARLIERLRAAKVEAVAVCLLHSYRRADHEKMIGDCIRREMPAVHVSMSHQVLPELLEFERTSTTVTNAYVAPLIDRYLATLRAGLKGAGIVAPILVMQSNGGLISASTAAWRPVTIIESGPAAGVIAAARIARQAGYANLITFDMGGTTTKASIIEDGAILRGHEYEVGGTMSASSRLSRGGGYVIRMPVIDISEIGNGGGSLAVLDPGGALRVGPRSAGSVPGPACYGNGTVDPTVTDANLMLGYIDPDSLAGGSLPIRRELAEKALERSIAERGGMSVVDAAHGVHMVANSNMVRAIRSVSVERGRDPADFVLMAFGGSGPIHAVSVAQSLGIKTVVVPPAPGVFSAFGLTRAEVEHHAGRTVLVNVAKADLPALQGVYELLRQEVQERMAIEGIGEASIRFQLLADLRYRGQSLELTVPLEAEALDARSLEQLTVRFEEEYEKTYGHRSERRDFELVSLRIIGASDRPRDHDGLWATTGDIVPSRAERLCYFGKALGMQETRVLRRKDLNGTPLAGPLIVQEYDATTVVPPNCLVAVDAHDNLIITT
jgi:N-methylhydantoinase A